MRGTVYRTKHIIRKQGPCWVLWRRTFGFSPHDAPTEHATFAAAMKAAYGKTASHAAVERTFTPYRAYTTWWREDNFPARIT